MNIDDVIDDHEKIREQCTEMFDVNIDAAKMSPGDFRKQAITLGTVMGLVGKAAAYLNYDPDITAMYLQRCAAEVSRNLSQETINTIDAVVELVSRRASEPKD